MIKINGLNCYHGNGDRYIFGSYLFKGNGIGKGIRSQYLFYSSTGTGWGDGFYFGDEKGNGESYTSFSFKNGFLKND